MNAWALTAPGSTTAAGTFSVDPLGYALDTVAAIGEPDFGTSALACLNGQVPVDFWSVYQISDTVTPKMYVSGSMTARDVSLDCFERYKSGLHRRDVTFSSARKVTASGANAMTLWNEAEIPSPHREQIYRRHDIFERLSLVSTARSGDLLAVNLYRFRGAGAYKAAEIDTIETLAKSLLACVQKHIQVLGLTREPAGQPSEALAPEVHWRDLLLRRCPKLTQREMDVCLRMLKGWTYEGIAVDLGLSLTTVKTYRARAFERLEIHFRNELFALAASMQASYRQERLNRLN